MDDRIGPIDGTTFCIHSDARSEEGLFLATIGIREGEGLGMLEGFTRMFDPERTAERNLAQLAICADAATNEFAGRKYKRSCR